MAQTLALQFPREVSDDRIRAFCNNFQDSLRLHWKTCREVTGKSYKILALELQERGHKTITESILSLWLSENPAQQKNFDPRAVDDFIQLTRLTPHHDSNIPSRYLALKDGCNLIRIESEVEKENRALLERATKAEEKLQTVVDLLNKSNVSLFK